MTQRLHLVELFDPDVPRDIGAGNFADWLEATRVGAPADVPCGECNGCCRSFYFIHIEPDEGAALAHIPAELLFPAPGRAPGHRVMGHDQFGCCPMLVDGACSIYQHRPRTCRVYDCRLFAATNLAAGESDKQLINDRARRWRFDESDPASASQQQAMLAASRFLRVHSAAFEVGQLPTNSTRGALLVLRIHELFLADAQRPLTEPQVTERIAQIVRIVQQNAQAQPSG